jgi:hypothetical protein
MKTTFAPISFVPLHLVMQHGLTPTLLFAFAMLCLWVVPKVLATPKGVF